MRWASLLVVLLGLSGVTVLGTTSACGSSGLSCGNPTSTQQTCLDCVNSSCSNDVAALQSSCPSSLVSCEEACNCGESACLSNCTKNADAGAECASTAVGLADCLESSCKSQCTTVTF